MTTKEGTPRPQGIRLASAGGHPSTSHWLVSLPRPKCYGRPLLHDQLLLASTSLSVSRYSTHWAHPSLCDYLLASLPPWSLRIVKAPTPKGPLPIISRTFCPHHFRDYYQLSIKVLLLSITWLGYMVHVCFLLFLIRHWFTEAILPLILFFIIVFWSYNSDYGYSIIKYCLIYMQLFFFL